MASKRRQIVEAAVERISALTNGGDAIPFGSVNAFVRAAAQVNDAPSVDVFAGNEDREQLASFQARRHVDLWVRLYGRQGDEPIMDDMIERIEDAIRSDPTLGGIVIDAYCTNVATDEGWAGFEGFGPMAQLRFVARDEQTED